MYNTTYVQYSYNCILLRHVRIVSVLRLMSACARMCVCVYSRIPETKQQLAKSRSNLESNVTKQRISGMPYSVEGTLQFCLADVSRLFRPAAVLTFFFLVDVVSNSGPSFVGFLAACWLSLARTQGSKHLEAQSRQSQLFNQIRYCGFLQVADYLASYQQSRQLLKNKKDRYCFKFLYSLCDRSCKMWLS